VNPLLVPEVSVILATYNRANLISAAVESVITQSFDNWELIVADDGSSDETFEIIRLFQQENTNIHYYRHTHRNLPLTRNAGIRISKGKYITFIDSDDIYLKDHLRLRINYMKENEEIELLHGGYKIIGNPYVRDKNDTAALIHLDQCFIGGTFFGNRNVFIEIGGFRDIPYSEDSDFMERALQKYKVKQVEYPTYIYHRDTTDSICNTI